MSLTLTISKCYKVNIPPFKPYQKGSTPLGKPLTKLVDLILTNNGKEAEFQTLDITPITYSVSMKKVDFHKKIYGPNEVIADLQITGTRTVNEKEEDVTMTPNKLSTYFSGKEVTLQDGNDTIASGYYVHEIIPRREKDSNARFATLKIYSPDNLWTIDKYSRSYVAKKIYCDILMDENETSDSESDSMARKISLPYDQNKSLSSLLNFQNVPDFIGTATTEQIHPYLVQYNETFYDFLVRTANRWGIFLYFEDGKLNFGYTDSTATELTSYKSISSYSIKQGTPLTVSLHSHNVEEPSKRVSIKQTEENIVDEVTRDEYRKSIKNGNYIYDKVIGEILVTDEEKDHARKAGGDGKYWMRKLADLLLKPYNLFSYLMTFIFDDWISYGRTRAVSDRRNKEYKEKYFSGSFKDGIRTIKVNDKDTNTYLRKEQYEIESSVSSPTPEKATSLYEFASAEQSKCPNSENYEKVLKGETTASQNLICVDLGEIYVHKLLGETFTLDGDTSTTYMVIQVDCVTETKTTYSVDTETIELKTPDDTVKTVTVVKDTALKENDPVLSQHYRIIAVKQEGTDWYPPIHENGHVRTSGPQLAYIVENNDPTRNMRYRVKYAWQSSDDTDLPSPWLPVANSMASKNSGAYFKFQENDQVLLDYEAGNIERPYIVGAVQNCEKKAHRLASLNIANLTTPAGHSLRLTDGTGAGILPFFASMNPLFKMIQSFCPIPSVDTDSEARCFEGGIEMCDKYGVYNIKASTNDRNITIKSSLGDITLNAFTGIKIDAPNGDVKIRGKNVTIEAGNNLKLSSGENIKKGFLGDVHNDFKTWVESSGTDLLMPMIEKTASFLDLSVLRHTFEVFLKPVEGTLQIKSNRFMKLEAGKGSAGFPAGMLGNSNFLVKSEAKNYIKLFERINAIAVEQVTTFLQQRRLCHNAYNTYFVKRTDDCKDAADLLFGLWGKGAEDTLQDGDLEFAGALLNPAADSEEARTKANIKEAAENLLAEIKKFKKLQHDDKIKLQKDPNNDSLKQAFENCEFSILVDQDQTRSGQSLATFLAKEHNYNHADNKRMARRLGCCAAVKLINSLTGDKKLKSENNSASVSAPAFDAADDVFDQQWANYVKYLTFDTGVNSTDKNKFRIKMEDMSFNNAVIFSNAADAFIWGGDNNAGILMSSGDGTFLVNNDGLLEKLVTEYKTRSYYAVSRIDLKDAYTLGRVKRALRGING